MVDCTRPNPRPVVRSVRWPASSCMRWSGLTPIAPALARRKAPPRPHPFVDKVKRQPFAQLELHHLVEPCLHDAEHEEAPRDRREHQKLVEERVEIATLDGIIEGTIPAVEDDLAE